MTSELICDDLNYWGSYFYHSLGHSLLRPYQFQGISMRITTSDLKVQNRYTMSWTTILWAQTQFSAMLSFFWMWKFMKNAGFQGKLFWSSGSRDLVAKFRYCRFTSPKPLSMSWTSRKRTQTQFSAMLSFFWMWKFMKNTGFQGNFFCSSGSRDLVANIRYCRSGQGFLLSNLRKTNGLTWTWQLAGAYSYYSGL